MNQSEFIHDYIEKTCDKFNPVLFTRSDKEIIEELKKIVLSCQRNGFFTIKVKNFRVVEEYYEVNEILQKYEDFLLSKKSSNARGTEDNRYSHIDLKSSDLKLLIVTYYISVKDEHDTIDVIIAVPRVVDKFYFRINGSYYSAMYQIVDASTYNNSTSKSAKHSVTLKTVFKPMRIFRNSIDEKSKAKTVLKTTAGEAVACTVYDNNSFSKSVPVALYMLAKMGYYGATSFLGISNAIILTDHDMEKPDEYYTFHPKKNSTVYINVPRMLFDGHLVLQHMIYTLCDNVHKDAKLEDMFNGNYWITCLGGKFNLNNPFEKGLNILDSLENDYDIATRQELHLPWEHKADIYRVLRWMICEYNNLKLKDNLNIMTKKLRCAEYIASIYAAKVANSMYRLSHVGKKMDLGSIRKVIITNPMYLVNQMTRCQLINFRNIVTDMDSLLALKFTYKGISGIGEKGGNAIPEIYKLLHVSNMGILDPDASSPSDPGISGSIVPTLDLYDNGYFSEFQEPVTYDQEYAKLYNSYREAKGLTEVLEFKRKILEDDTVTDADLILARECEEATANIMHIATEDLDSEEETEFIGLPLEPSGLIYYE